MIFHAPIGMIVLLFAVSVLVVSPQGGLDGAPPGVVANALAGGVSATAPDVRRPFTQIALAN